MSKKIIKYLIWIILVTATLILMPTKETMAATSLSYSTFRSSPNYFCLNKGYSFHGTENFNVSTISDATFTFPNSNGASVDTDVLKYIISESTSGKYGSRSTVENYTPQKAIWKLAGTSISSSAADTLIAEAYAYNSFISNSKVPTIEKEGADKVVVYYYETSYDGHSYTNLDSISVTGASYTSTTTCNYNGYNRKKTYTKNEGATEATVTVNYETSRWANLELWTSIERTKTVTYLRYSESHSWWPNMSEFMIIDGAYYHANCSSAQDNNCYLVPYDDGPGYRCRSCNRELLNQYNGGSDYSVKFSDSEAYALYPSDPVTITDKPQNLLHGDGGINTTSKQETIKFGVNLTINKTDSLTGSKLPGAKFKVEFTNVSSIDGYTGGTSTVIVTTDSNGQIKLTGILPSNFNSAITAKITEVEVPTVSGWYYKVNSTPVTVNITYSNGNWSASGGGATVSDGTVSVGIANQPYIDLSGNVWQDAQIGEKNVSGPNGVKDDGETNLQGVIVQLYSAKAGRVIEETTTDSNGNYSFTSIKRTLEGFKIIFKYNGITYVETPNGTASKPAEVGRTTFNNRFKTISKGQSNDGTALQYTYNNEKSTLNSNIAGHTTGTTDAKFQMSAQTAAYNTTASDVNCGLVKKNFDLAVGTDVKSAKLKINEKETTYSYAQIMDGALDFQNSSSSKENVVYNLYLYSSDYNYRIDDYITDLETDRKVNSQRPEAGYKETEGDNNNDRIKKLQAYVTYSVILKSQTTKAVTASSTVEQFLYYYDSSVYTPEFSVNDIIDGYKVISIQGNKIIFESASANNALTESNNYRKEVNLTFEVNKDGDNIILKDSVTNIAEITKYSTSEGGLIDKDSAPENGISNGKITQYEDDTDEAKGLNIVLKTDETRTIEGTVFDDTVKKDEEGKASYDKDGKLNNENSGVNDVIVQLIEIKKISGKYYEYIWQETRSGSNQVKTTARNGYTGTTYTNSVTEDGKYEFKDFIPGNYIIRYIYGDGTTYDVTDNVKKYNGQDYKSTIDPNYNKPWYNTAGYVAGDSIARDNEARRLEVMTYSTTINGTNGAHLANKTDEALQNTWMCAETSRINIPVDADNKATDNNSTTASYAYTKNNTKVLFGDMNFGLALRPQENIVLEKHITALKITPSGTGVQPIVDAKAKDLRNATGELLEEAIQRIVNGETVEVEGVTNGLAIIKSTAEERGFWQVATDVEELMQGAELEVEYTYVLRNDSEENYLSNTLIQAYENQDIKPYNTVLSEVTNTVKETMRNGTYSYSNSNTIGTYLGEYYYNGKISSNADVNLDGVIDTGDLQYFWQYLQEINEDIYGGDLNGDGKVNMQDFNLLKSYLAGEEVELEHLRLVSSRVESFEEALNNDLAFDETEGTSFKIKEQEPNKKYYVYGVDKAEGTKETQINTVVENVAVSTYLTPKLEENHTTETADWSKTIKLRTTLATVGGGELGAVLPSHIAEILQYSNAAGRKDMTASPANLSYVNSDDREMTMESDNEQDEFWSESIIITKPTGENKLTVLQILLTTITAIVVLGAGVVLIKKYVLKK